MGFRALGLAMLVLAATASEAAAECKPAAILEGEPALVEGLAARLAASGIATTATPGCPVVRIWLEQRGPQLHLKLADAFRRTGERDVQDVATAAAIVESWTQQEVDAGTLPPDAAAPAIAEPHLVRSGIGASIASAVGSNGGTTWLGASLAACARTGPLCAGAAVRAETDTRATGATKAIDQDSYALVPMATLDLPRRLGGFVLSPGIGVGYAYLHVTTHHHDAMNNPLDVPTADHELRAGAHVALLHALGDHLSLFADLWSDAALARSDSQFGPGVSLRLSFGIRLEAP